MFSPIKIGPMEVRNRIALAPMATYMADNKGAMTQSQIDFLEARAKGGTGLLILGSIYVQHPIARFGEGQHGLYEDSLTPGYKQLIDTIKPYGPKIAAQLHHAGRQTTRAAIEGHQPVAPSPISLGGKYIDEPRELSIYEIQDIVNYYGETARRCIEAGFDAIELHYAHGYLPTQFMSPLSNKRSDEYGGDLTDRMKFPLEVFTRVKKQVGSNIPVWCRIIGSELVDGGLTIDDMKEVAKILVKAGSSAISVTRGIAPYYWSIANYFHDLGHSLRYAKEIKSQVNVPVMVAGRINDHEQVEKILRSGEADIIAMGRALIADPDWPNKVAGKRFKDIIPCISCNKGCHDPNKKNRETTCLVNAASGREREFEIKPAKKKKKVMVIGGGLAGLEAARIAAIRGHYVTLYEKNQSLGGRWLLAAKPPFKEHYNQVTDYLTNQAEMNGVKFELGKCITFNEVKDIQPEVIIIATGARPIIPQISGINQSNVVTADTILKEKVQAGDRVVVIGAGETGAETAHFLSTKSKQVILVEMLDEMCQGMVPDEKFFLMEKLNKAKVQMFASTMVQKIENHTVFLQKKDQEHDLIWNSKLENIDTIVLSVGVTSNNELANNLKEIAPIYMVGDCVKPQDGLEAIYEGSKVARTI